MAEADEHGGQSFGRAARDIAILAVLLAAAFGWYWRHVQVRKEAQKLALAAKEKLTRDTPKDLLDAEKDLNAVLQLDASQDFAVSSLAEMNALLWGEHGLADRKAEAEKWTAKAEAIGATIGERYAARALIL